MSQAEVQLTNKSQAEVEMTVEIFETVYFYTCIVYMYGCICQYTERERERGRLRQSKSQKLVLRRDVGNHHFDCSRHLRIASGSTKDVSKTEMNRT